MRACWHRTGCTHVSIHTRHYWRVKQAVEAVAEQQDRVSIHTRHYWRVKRVRIVAVLVDDGVSIHTRHYWRVKRSISASAARSRMFQSTPAITGG